MTGTGQGSGKVILLGEHAVVYGVPALATGIARGAWAEASLRAADGEGAWSGGEVSRLRLGGAIVSDKLMVALQALLADGTPLPPCVIQAASELPPGGGLGSSAALGVAIARAAMAAAGRPDHAAEAMDRASAWERIFHGNPSGIDTAAAALGGCFRFTRKDGPTPLIAARDMVLCVAQSGTVASTRVMVEGLARLRDREPVRVDRAFDDIAALVEGATRAVATGDWDDLGARMDRNHAILAALHLSTDRLDALCSMARCAGALGAKLTGKGGGGAVIALAEDDDRAMSVLAAWRAAGHEGFITKVATRTTP